ncbi:hypothetical protein [Marinobacter sp. X15-166B]|uniref:hypothetical protein n=1 Tax=Marinobacter sp. X15-166B TaxID=1897620 RepID=UPI00085BF7BF|nr:hypothetical protein [Marinobacter sp. X15-166B]OEY68040.1 hypothetical protein BG841_12180 [Marinobacter sp. X15-166B]
MIDQTTTTTSEPTSPVMRTSATLSAAEVAAYWAERRNYLKQLRTSPELKQQYRNAVLAYLLRRLLWSFGFFPVALAFWLPLVFASFNPVVMVGNLMPMLQSFLDANPEVQATTISNLTLAWLSIGLFFLVFDLILTPFKSPYQYEADVHMRSWELLNQDKLADKV